jgi:acetyltransferase-like isoleucine patch superfamily enzyme
LLPLQWQGPVIRRFAVVGSGANIAAGVEIGMGAIVAPNAMVTDSVAPWTIVAGIPAVPIRPVAANDRRQILDQFGLPRV